MGFPSWRIGDVRLTSVLETELTYPLEDFLGQPRSAIDPHRDWMAPFLTATDELRMPVQAFLVEADGRRIIVDTCIGNGRDYGSRMAQFNGLDTPFLDNLSQCGFDRDAIDYVVITHLHLDHVGWNTIEIDGRIEPTFANAHYVMSAADIDHYRERPSFANPFELSVAPLLAAGLVDAVVAPHTITPSVSLVPTPGHTPGHASVRIESDREVAYITGDMVHSPIQFAYPDWKSIADVDPDQAARSRHWLIGEVGDTPMRVVGTHFAAPTVGHVVRDDHGWRFVG